MKPSSYSNTPLKTALADRCDDWHRAYPRPAFRRADETCRILTDWQLSCLDEKTDTVISLGPIRLPFPPEAPLSGICKTPEDGEAWLYQTAFSLSDAERGGRVLLHLPPTDQTCIVTLNSKVYKERISFPCPSDLDVTDAVMTGANTLTVLVHDSLDTDIPYGKQSKKRGGMWYTPTSGMRGMPWLEFVPKQYIEALHITPTLDSVVITVRGCETALKTITYETENAPVTTQFTGESVTMNIENPHLWSPDDPYVYRFTIQCGEDTVSSYFALREISVQTADGRAVLCLNGKPHYFHGLLDQGYDPDGIELPAAPDGYLRDIENAKALGFDTLRKHIRLEDPYFIIIVTLRGCWCSRILSTTATIPSCATLHFRPLDCAAASSVMHPQNRSSISPMRQTASSVSCTTIRPWFIIQSSTRAGDSLMPMRCTVATAKQTRPASGTPPPAGSLAKKAMCSRSTSISAV